MLNLYEILDVKPDADMDTIKKAYKRKAQVTHPDKNNGDSNLFHQVALAYNVLSDPDRRAKYDKTGEVKEEPYNQAEATLVSLFMSVIANNEYKGDVIVTCKKKIAVRRHELTRDLTKHQSTLTNLRRQISRVKCDGMNLYENLVSQQIEKLTKTCDAINAELEILGSVEGLLAAYTDTKPEENSHVNWTNIEFG